MTDAGEKFDPKSYIPAVAGYYTDSEGPDAVVPVQQLDDGVLLQQGRVQEGRPRSEQAAEDLAGGGRCGGQAQGLRRTPCAVHHGLADRGPSSRASRAWHNVPFATKQNGFAGPDAKLVFNGPLQVRHIENLQDMAKKGFFVYAGRSNEPEAKFYSGECAMMTTSSAATARSSKNAKFDFGVSHAAVLPRRAGRAAEHDHRRRQPVGDGRQEEGRVQGVSPSSSPSCRSPEVQAAMPQATGYLPITTAAYELTKKSGFYEKNPGTDVAVKQMIGKTTDKSRGIRLGNFVADPRHRSTKSWSRCGAARRPRRKRWTPPSSAATSRWRSSRVRSRSDRASARRRRSRWMCDLRAAPTIYLSGFERTVGRPPFDPDHRRLANKARSSTRRCVSRSKC